jgi:hypothetical protein
MTHRARMVVLPVNLHLDLYESLHKEALRQGCSMAAVIRRELQEALGERDAQKRKRTQKKRGDETLHDDPAASKASMNGGRENGV